MSPTVVAGNKQQFTATTLDQNNAPIGAALSWLSSNTTVGTVNSTGSFTALSAGTTTVTVTATNGSVTKTASTTVTVQAPSPLPVLTKVKISPSNPTIVVGHTRQFKAKTFDQNNAPIGAILSWSSSNTTVGTINSSGLFTASTAGTTIVTVTATNETVTVSNTSKVTVIVTGKEKHKQKKHDNEEHQDQQREDQQHEIPATRG